MLTSAPGISSRTIWATSPGRNQRVAAARGVEAAIFRPARMAHSARPRESRDVVGVGEKRPLHHRYTTPCLVGRRALSIGYSNSNSIRLEQEVVTFRLANTS